MNTSQLKQQIKILSTNIGTRIDVDRMSLSQLRSCLTQLQRRMDMLRKGAVKIFK